MNACLISNLYDTLLLRVRGSAVVAIVAGSARPLLGLGQEDVSQNGLGPQRHLEDLQTLQ